MEKLPHETLVRIYQFLPFKDLKNCLLISRRLSEAAEESILWKNFPLKINQRNIRNLADILSLPRYRYLRSAIIQNCKLTNKDIRVISDSSLRTVQLGQHGEVEKDCNFSSLSAKLFASAVTKLEVFKLHNSLITEMSLIQMQALLAEISSTRSLLRTLELYYNNHLTCVIPDTLTSSLCNLSELTLIHQKLAPFKYENLFIAISKRASKLKMLNLSCNNLSHVNHEIFAKGICRINKTIISDCKLTLMMFGSLFSLIIEADDVNLTNLDVSYNSNLRLLDPYLFAKALCNLTTVSISHCKVLESQLISLCNIFTANSVKFLNLSGNASSTKIPALLLSQVVSRLEAFSLKSTKLSSLLLCSIFSELANESSCLKALDIGGDFRLIDERILASAFRKLHKVNLANVILSQEQYTFLSKEFKEKINIENFKVERKIKRTL